MQKASSCRLRFKLSVLLVLSALGLNACILFTDAGTRLAEEIKDGADTLRRSEKERLEVVHTPLSVLSGIKGPYEVEFQQSINCTKCRTLSVTDTGYESGNYSPGGGSTTYQTNFVIVPHELKIQKKKGEPVVIVLHKRDNAIEVESLR